MSQPQAVRYDDMADHYDSSVGDSVMDPATAALIELAGEVRQRRILELACGQGRVARALTRRGGLVVAVDISEALLERARAAEHERAFGVRYLHADASLHTSLDGWEFDVVVCNFGLTDIDNLEGALLTAARVLAPGGTFAYSILQPCFPGWGTDAPSSWQPGAGYYVERWWRAQNTGFRGRVGSNHRMLSTYLNAVANAGFILERVLEPEPGPEWAARQPGGDAVRVYFAARHRRAHDWAWIRKSSG